MFPPEWKTAPYLSDPGQEAVLVPRPVVNEAGIVLCNLCRQIFLGCSLATCGPLEDGADRRLVHRLEAELRRITDPDDPERDVVAPVRRIRSCFVGRLLVGAPVLPDRHTVGKRGWAAAGEMSSVLLGAVDDVPLRMLEKRVRVGAS